MKKGEVIHLLSDINQYLFELEQLLENDIQIGTDKWVEYYGKIANIHKTLWELEHEIEKF